MIQRELIFFRVKAFPPGTTELIYSMKGFSSQIVNCIWRTSVRSHRRTFTLKTSIFRRCFVNSYLKSVSARSSNEKLKWSRRSYAPLNGLETCPEFVLLNPWSPKLFLQLLLFHFAVHNSAAASLRSGDAFVIASQATRWELEETSRDRCLTKKVLCKNRMSPAFSHTLLADIRNTALFFCHKALSCCLSNAVLMSHFCVGYRSVSGKPKHVTWSAGFKDCVRILERGIQNKWIAATLCHQG